MEFISYTFSADHAIDKFTLSCSGEKNSFGKHLQQKMDLCKFRIHLISRENVLKKFLPQSKEQILCINQIFSAWNQVSRSETVPSTQFQNWQIIDKIGEKVPSSCGKLSSPVLRRFTVSQFRDEFFLLITGKEDTGLPFYELNFLCNLWQMEHGFLPVHAAGLIHKEHLYIFLGPSGTGKSTISYQSLIIGDSILDEDQLVLYKNNQDQFSSNAWGYSTRFCDFPIRAIFRIIKSNEDKLICLPKSSTTRLIIEGSQQILGMFISGKILFQTFMFASRVARQIPAYELHFRKSPDFWKVIDAELP